MVIYSTVKAEGNEKATEQQKLKAEHFDKKKAVLKGTCIAANMRFTMKQVHHLPAYESDGTTTTAAAKNEIREIVIKLFCDCKIICKPGNVRTTAPAHVWQPESGRRLAGRVQHEDGIGWFHTGRSVNLCASPPNTEHSMLCAQRRLHS